MSLRLVEIITSKENEEIVKAIVEEFAEGDSWSSSIGKKEVSVRCVTQAESFDEMLEAMELDLGEENFKVLIFQLVATLPHIEQEEEENNAYQQEKKNAFGMFGKWIRLNKEEIYTKVDEGGTLSANFIFLVIFSAIVAGIGILQDSLPVVIGAMVIAPFLGPNVALAFASTLGDYALWKKAAYTTSFMIGVTLLISVIWGVISSKDISNLEPEVTIGYRDVTLALVCGFAGVITMLSGQVSPLVGVMVAAALLPPLMQTGLFLGGELYKQALYSFLIFSTNIISLNIAGIVTFYLSGIRPHKWWEKANAMHHLKKALLFWGLTFLLLVGAIIALKILNPFK